MSSTPLLAVDNLRGYYKGEFGVVKAVDGVSFSLYREILGIVGESGCGKSSLLKLLTGVPPPPLYYVSGDIVVKGINITKLSFEEIRTKVLGRLLVYMPQAVFDSLNPTKRLWSFFYDIVKEHGIELDKEKAIQLLSKHFESLGLDPSIVTRYPFELSGGMRQRAVLAMVAGLHPSILMLDEPTSALDVATQKRILEFIARLFKEGYSEGVLISSHDIGVIRQITHRVMVMYAGKVVEISPTDDIIENPQHPYTELLLKSLEPLEKWGSKRTISPIEVTPGEPPSLIEPPPGCRFHPRCPYAMDICRKKEPPIIELEKNRIVSCWLYEKK